VIEQDSYWRQDLLKFAERLEKRYRQKKWSDRTRYNIEKEIFLSFYIIRKLIESRRIRGSVASSRHTVMWYPIIIGETPSTDPKTFVFTYLLYHGWREEWTRTELYNQFVHSYIFSPFRLCRGDMLGIYFASDCQSKTGLYYITLVKVIEIIISAGRNRPTKLKLGRKTEGGFEVNLKSASSA
jgi:uncharacterized membrane protein